MKSEFDKYEEMTQETVDEARKFESAFLVFLLGKISNVLKDDSKRARAEAIKSINDYTQKETKSFLKRLKKASSNDLKKVGDYAYKNLDKRSKGRYKSNASASKFSKQADDYFKKYIKTKGKAWVITNNQSPPQFFITFIEKYVKELVEGKISLEEAISKSAQILAQNGVKIIQYDSGTTRTIETFVRQQMNYVSKKVAEDIRINNAKKDNVTIWEFDAHANARPSHQLWQGKRYDTTGKYYPKLNELTHGEHEDYGCKHIAFPVYDKSDPYMFTKEQLENINIDPFEWNGKVYDGYEATQKMRQIERKIREKKKEIMLLKSQNIDTTKQDYLLKKYNKEYTSFCKAFGTYRRNNRLKVY